MLVKIDSIHGLQHVALIVGLSTAASCTPAAQETQRPHTQHPLSLSVQGGAEWAWGVTKDSSIDIGDAKTSSCFLSGVTGNLSVTPSLYVASVSVGTSASNGETHALRVIPFASHPLEGFARCIGNNANRSQSVSWSTGRPAVELGDATARRRCFLTEISVFNSGASGGFKTDDDLVHVYKQQNEHGGMSWWLGGSQTEKGGVRASAQCIDVVQEVAYTLHGAKAGETRRDPIAINTGNMNCFLTGVQGRFDRNDYSDGVYISYESGLNEYFVNTTNGKKAEVMCVR